MILYSKLTSEIHNKINRESFDPEGVWPLIKKSYEYGIQSSSDYTQSLHNKLLDYLLVKHPGQEASNLAEEYWIHPGSAELVELEKRFSIDPSNYSIVYKLAVEYAAAGERGRAKQLLERIERSGYREKQQAISSLKEIVKEVG